MVVAQITDIHISPDFKPIHKVDVVKNFERILAAVAADETVTHIALTGDLCAEEGRLSTMQWVRRKLEETGKPFFVIPGNHDDSVIMAQVFDRDDFLHGEEFYFNMVVDGWNLIFLDTAKGLMTVDQLSWLMAIDSIQPEPSLIFMHHPPVDAVPYMDANHALGDKAEVQRTLARLKQSRAIFCGHYHVGKTVEHDGLPPVYITPATFFQIDDQTEEFKISSYDIGWRRIATDSSGEFQESLHWLPTAPISD